MTELDRIERDLGYVRQAVDRAEDARSPAAIYVLWAAIVTVGFSLVDFAPERVPLYWMVVAPAGWFVSVYLGWRHSRACGQLDSRYGLRISLHWVVMMGAVLLTALLPATGRITGNGLAAVILLIVALTYVLAGLHLERSMAWIGLVMGAGYVAVVTLDAYVWTLVGVMVGAAMLLAAILGRSADAGTPA